MSEVTRFVFDDKDGALATRAQGSALRAEMERAIKVGGTIEVVLKSVGAMTPSFIDECLGKLLVSLGKAEFRKRVRLVTSNREDKLLVNRVLADRLQGQLAGG